MQIGHALSRFVRRTNVDNGTLIVGDDTIHDAQIGGDVIIAKNALLSASGRVTGYVNNDGIIWLLNAIGGHEDVALSNLNLGGLTNIGTIDLAKSSIGNTVTVNGDYYGDKGV
ncbi:hypothetical protein [Bartonella tamiae]|uniref:Uncharacterized protein n=1 Tax=Bartonella tamiae Th239 TaxID=1094558 RepID=J0ZNY8_9HYPH|nr:hypothetical protein [Bartonella tamiae]EJF90283.1 hypothetical protein ME5_00684 [Bartonella tamiae Th239]EJF93776.1 hypothetical protein MEG_01200 [Bartonella tamiae Th307]